MANGTPSRAMLKTRITVGPIAFGVEMHKASDDGKDVALNRACFCGNPVRETVCCTGKDQHTFPSIFQVPDYGYPAKPKDGKFLVTFPVSEADEFRRGKEYKTLAVEKVVDLTSFALRYGFKDSYFLLPERDMSEDELTSYATFVKVLGARKQAMLSRLTNRGTNWRVAIVADTAKGVLVALKVLDMKDLPRDVALPTPNEEQEGDIVAFQDRKVKADVAFPSDDKSLVPLIEQKMEAAAKVLAEQSAAFAQKAAAKEAGEAIVDKLAETQPQPQKVEQ